MVVLGLQTALEDDTEEYSSLVNPGNVYIIERGDIALVLAPSRKAAQRLGRIGPKDVTSHSLTTAHCELHQITIDPGGCHALCADPN